MNFFYKNEVNDLRMHSQNHKRRRIYKETSQLIFFFLNT